MWAQEGHINGKIHADSEQENADSLARADLSGINNFNIQ